MDPYQMKVNSHHCPIFEPMPSFLLGAGTGRLPELAPDEVGFDDISCS